MKNHILLALSAIFSMGLITQIRASSEAKIKDAINWQHEMNKELQEFRETVGTLNGNALRNIRANIKPTLIDDYLDDIHELESITDLTHASPEISRSIFSMLPFVSQIPDRIKEIVKDKTKSDPALTTYLKQVHKHLANLKQEISNAGGINKFLKNIIGNLKTFRSEIPALPIESITLNSAGISTVAELMELTTILGIITHNLKILLKHIHAQAHSSPPGGPAHI